MKKVLIFLTVIFLSSCTKEIYRTDDEKINKLENKLNELSKNDSLKVKQLEDQIEKLIEDLATQEQEIKDNYNSKLDDLNDDLQSLKQDIVKIGDANLEQKIKDLEEALDRLKGTRKFSMTKGQMEVIGFMTSQSIAMEELFDNNPEWYKDPKDFMSKYETSMNKVYSDNGIDYRLTQEDLDSVQIGIYRLFTNPKTTTPQKSIEDIINDAGFSSSYKTLVKELETVGLNNTKERMVEAMNKVMFKAKQLNDNSKKYEEFIGFMTYLYQTFIDGDRKFHKYNNFNNNNMRKRSFKRSYPKPEFLPPNGNQMTEADFKVGYYKYIIDYHVGEGALIGAVFLGGVGGIASGGTAIAGGIVVGSFRCLGRS